MQMFCFQVIGEDLGVLKKVTKLLLENFLNANLVSLISLGAMKSTYN